MEKTVREITELKGEDVMIRGGALRGHVGKVVEEFDMEGHRVSVSVMLDNGSQFIVSLPRKDVSIVGEGVDVKTVHETGNVLN